MARSDRFYRNLNLQRCLVFSSPFWLAALASQDLNAVNYNATDMSSLRTAIDNANGNTTSDVITLAAGTYTLTGSTLDNSNNSGDLDITKAQGDLTIEPASGATVVLDGNSIDRLFHIDAGGGVTVTIRNVTIQNARATDNGTGVTEARGGAILLDAGDLDLENVTIDSCSAEGVTGSNGAPGVTQGGSGGFGGAGGAGGAALGGAVYQAGGTLQISDSTLSNNTAIGGAGGDGGRGGDGTPSTSSVSSLYGDIGGAGGVGGSGGAARGGAVYSAAGTLSLSSTTISGGSATGGDGGDGGRGGDGVGPIPSTQSIAFCAGGQGGSGGAGGAASGGAVYVAGGSVTIANSTLNAASGTAGNGGNGGDGGDGAGTGGVSLIFNIAGSGGDGGDAGAPEGGGVGIGAGTVAINNSTIAGHAMTGATGGSAGAIGGGSLTSTASSGQAGAGSSAQGGGVFIGGGSLDIASTIVADNTAASGADISGTVTAGASLIESTTGANIISGTGANVTGQDPQLSALANNGGPTDTMAIDQNSPARNVGSNPLSLTTDQRGTGFNRDDGNGVDMGAFEYGTTGGTTPPTVSDPSGAITLNAGTYDVQGTAPADSLVRIYSDANDNGQIDGADAVVAQQQLTGGATGFNVTVTLSQDADNNFTATAEDASTAESGPVDVPAITEDSTAPTTLTVTNPASPTSTVGTSYIIQGTTEADALVQIYNDANDNGLIDSADAMIAQQQLTGGATSFSINTPILQGQANNCTVTATDGAGNESNPVDVPTITETSTPTNPPVVTNPASPVTVDLATFTVQGTAIADALVRIYSDTNDNGLIDGTDAVVAQDQLTGGATSWSITVNLTQSAINNFLATAEGGGNIESNPTNVPTITDTAPVTGGGSGGGSDAGGGCATTGGRGFAWLGGILVALMGVLGSLRRRRNRA